MSAPARASLAIFTILKPLGDPHIELIQRNALRSWTRLRPRAEIIAFCDETTLGLATELGVTAVTDFASSPHGAPLIDSVFARAEETSDSPLLAYVNADILLLGEFVTAAERVARAKPRFLMVGSRWDLDVSEPLDFAGDWERELRARVARAGTLHPPAGSDYFVFPRGFWSELPPFALGRNAFDNWLIYRARTTGAAVVDASRSVLVVHQNHDYAHIGGVEATWSGPDEIRNYDLAGGQGTIYFLTDASHLLTARGVVPALSAPHLRQRTARLFSRHALLRKAATRFGRVAGALRTLARRARSAESA